MSLKLYSSFRFLIVKLVTRKHSNKQEKKNARMIWDTRVCRLKFSEVCRFLRWPSFCWLLIRTAWSTFFRRSLKVLYKLRRRLLPDNSSRPPTRSQAATLKRNKKAIWQRFLHSLHFLRDFNVQLALCKYSMTKRSQQTSGNFFLRWLNVILVL